MKTIGLVSAVGLVSVLLVALTGATTAQAEEGLVRTTWPSAEDPGMPFYARVELLPPYIFNNGEWAAIVFYRNPDCVPPNFNLISVFDVPAAFSCPHTVQGASLWQGEIFNGAPKSINISGSGAVPVWFVPWEAVKDQAKADGVLTVTDLLQIEDRLVGYADHYAEELQPHPDPAFGGGGHPNPKMIVNAHGQLEDGRAFKLHITWVHDEVRSIQIQFN
ncbi:MAG: hypothetical protein R3300_00555 [Candidatus Promineifilaceae bacterium]|nr:hypothetical protein [Candidatus Promineifilaceae bacterium]